MLTDVLVACYQTLRGNLEVKGITMLFGSPLQLHIYPTVCIAFHDKALLFSDVPITSSLHDGNNEAAGLRQSNSHINQFHATFSNPLVLFSLLVFIYLCIISNGTTFVSWACMLSLCESTKPYYFRTQSLNCKGDLWHIHTRDIYFLCN